MTPPDRDTTLDIDAIVAVYLRDLTTPLLGTIVGKAIDGTFDIRIQYARGNVTLTGVSPGLVKRWYLPLPPRKVDPCATDSIPHNKSTPAR